MIDFANAKVFTGCQNGCDDFTVPLRSSLSEAFIERDYYVLYTGYSLNHPFGDTILCSECRKKSGLPSGVFHCPCCTGEPEASA